jgi:hypothetical protein
LGHAADAMSIERGLGDVPGILKVVADVAIVEFDAKKQTRHGTDPRIYLSMKFR